MALAYNSSSISCILSKAASKFIGAKLDSKIKEELVANIQAVPYIQGTFMTGEKSARQAVRRQGKMRNWKNGAIRVFNRPCAESLCQPLQASTNWVKEGEYVICSSKFMQKFYNIVSGKFNFVSLTVQTRLRSILFQAPFCLPVCGIEGQLRITATGDHAL
jgi:hypothetical protein